MSKAIGALVAFGVIGAIAMASGGTAGAAEPIKPTDELGKKAFEAGYADATSACASGGAKMPDSAKMSASGNPEAYADGWKLGCDTATLPPIGGGPPADELLPGTTTKKSRVRQIDKSTGTPSEFAQKYSGTASRWQEIAAANPAGTVYPGSPAIIVKTIYTLDVDPSTGETLPTGKNVSGMQPWMLGQLVKLPDTWAG